MALLAGRYHFIAEQRHRETQNSSDSIIDWRLESLSTPALASNAPNPVCFL
jgi:hypothetical protein